MLKENVISLLKPANERLFYSFFQQGVTKAKIHKWADTYISPNWGRITMSSITALPGIE